MTNKQLTIGFVFLFIIFCLESWTVNGIYSNYDNAVRINNGAILRVIERHENDCAAISNLKESAFKVSPNEGKKRVRLPGIYREE